MSYIQPTPKSFELFLKNLEKKKYFDKVRLGKDWFGYWMQLINCLFAFKVAWGLGFCVIGSNFSLEFP